MAKYKKIEERRKQIDLEKRLSFRREYDINDKKQKEFDIIKKSIDIISKKSENINYNKIEDQIDNNSSDLLQQNINENNLIDNSNCIDSNLINIIENNCKQDEKVVKTENVLIINTSSESSDIESTKSLINSNSCSSYNIDSEDENNPKKRKSITLGISRSSE